MLVRIGTHANSEERDAQVKRQEHVRMQADLISSALDHRQHIVDIIRASPWVNEQKYRLERQIKSTGRQSRRGLKERDELEE